VAVALEEFGKLRHNEKEDSGRMPGLAGLVQGVVVHVTPKASSHHGNRRSRMGIGNWPRVNLGTVAPSIPSP